MWTTPHDWADGEKVTASLLNLIRDNLRVLYKPPHCRVSGLGSPSQVRDAAGNTTWGMVGFPNTVTDTDSMRTLSGLVQNEPADGPIEVQTAGHYLASAVLAFDNPGQSVAAAVRADYTSGSVHAGTMASGGGAGVFTFPEVIPVVAAWSCTAGYQWYINLYAPGDTKMLLIRAGRIPYFHVTWIGGP